MSFERASIARWDWGPRATRPGGGLLRAGGLHGLVRVLAVVGMMCLLNGCAWMKTWQKPASEPHPLVFATPPSLEQALGAVNSNTQRVTHLNVPYGKLSIAGLPSLNLSLAVERPARLRMRAETTLTGPELDLGSNEEIFWLWEKRNQPAGIFFARHDRFAASPARQMMPVDPNWIVEALGLVEFDPRMRHEGPFAHGKGNFEVRTRVPSPAGELMKVVVINDRLGYVEEENVYDPRGVPVATARLLDQRYYAAHGVSLPRRIEISMPAMNLAFRLDLPEHLLNQPTYDAGALYTMPTIQGYPAVDIADPSFRPPGLASGGQRPSPEAAPTAYTAAADRGTAPAGSRPLMRGFSARR